jgi:hypothetical protein
MTRSQRKILDRRVLYPGDVLIREGDYGDSAFFVQSGQVGVYKRSGGEEVLITVLPGNSIVGEMALIDNARRSATVRCLETASVVAINRTDFERKMTTLDPFMKALLEMFTQKLRRLNAEYCEAETKLQWLLRNSGLESKLGKIGPATPAQRKTQPAAAEAAPAATAAQTPPPAAAAPPAPEPSGTTYQADLGGEILNKFNSLKLELALLYHPECRGNHAQQTLSREEIFHEIWAALEAIENDPNLPD